MKTTLRDETIQSLNARGIHIADGGAETMTEIFALRKSSYEKLYPEIKNHAPDQYDQNGMILFSRDQRRNVTSTARIVFDSSQGLPSEAVLRPLIPASFSQSQLAEIGRFVINGDPSSRTLRNYFAGFYLIGVELGLTFVFLASVDTIRFYEGIVGARILSASTGQTYGSNKPFAAYLWYPHESSTRFKKMAGV